MANKDRTFGFKLVGKIGSSVQNNGTTEYKLPLVQLEVYSQATPKNDCCWYYTRLRCCGEQPILGIFRGCKFVDTDGSVVFKAHYPSGQTSTSTITALVEDDPNNLYEVQCTGSLALVESYANADLAKKLVLLLIANQKLR